MILFILALTPWAETLNDLESFSSSGLPFSPSMSLPFFIPYLSPGYVQVCPHPFGISVWTCAKWASLCPLNNCVKLFLSFSQFSFHFHFPPLLWRSWKVICILWSPRISKHHVLGRLSAHGKCGRSLNQSSSRWHLDHGLFPLTTSIAMPSKSFSMSSFSSSTCSTVHFGRLSIHTQQLLIHLIVHAQHLLLNFSHDSLNRESHVQNFQTFSFGGG